MLIFSRERQAIAALQPLLNLAPSAIPIVVVFGVITALSEGLGLSLFIPLFQNLTQDSAMPGETVLGRMWDVLFAHLPTDHIRWVAPLVILFLLGCKNGLLFLNTLIFSRFNWRISHRLRTQIYRQLLHVDAQFLMERDVGMLVSILDKEAWQTTQALTTLATAIASACTLVVFSGLLLLTSWRLTLVSLALMALISVGIQRLIRHVKRLGQQATQANMGFVGRGIEGLSGLQTIQLFGRQEFEHQQFERASSQVCTTFMGLDRLMGAVVPLSEFAFATLLTGLLIFVSRGDTNVSVFLTFLFMLYRLLPQVKNLDAARANLIALTASVNVVTELMTATRQRQVRNGDRPFATLERSIEFRQVSFQYQPDAAPALDRLSLTIRSGQTTAIVGPSGAGKSTIIGSILRQFDPTRGTVTVDGQPLPTYDLETWRSRIALVSQNIYLFNTSIRDNIAYGRPDASETAIQTAAEMANIHEVILAMPQGYDTVIGERGLRLSGGQRQRLALARALIRDPQILILDEATNALDSLSENLIQETLKAVGRDCTVIVVAHRLSTIEQADTILVIDSGQLAEQGNISELLERDGLFARMYRLQSMTPANVR